MLVKIHQKFYFPGTSSKKFLKIYFSKIRPEGSELIMRTDGRKDITKPTGTFSQLLRRRLVSHSLLNKELKFSKYLSPFISDYFEF